MKVNMMNDLIDELKHYIKQTVGISVSVPLYKDALKLPFVLRDYFEFYSTKIMDHVVILMVPKTADEFTPSEIGKHIGRVREAVGRSGVVFMDRSISLQKRNRLIMNKVPFIVPGNQMYLPELMIDLREHFKAASLLEFKKMLPSSQAVVLYIINNPLKNPVTPSAFAALLGYTKTTMTKVIKELLALEIITVAKDGRCKLIGFDTDPEKTWNKSLPYFGSPVYLTISIKKLPKGIKAFLSGESALSDNSMLGAPLKKVYAIGKNEFTKHEKTIMSDQQLWADEGNIKLQVWQYEPALLTDNKVVDKFSLYLSLRHNEDDRVQISLDEMIGEINW
jgi:DNA-binding MarR family transcriptional regulator